MMNVPLPPPTTFAEYYSDAANDPHAGDYQTVMAQFLESNPLSNQDIFRLATQHGRDPANAWIGLTTYPDEPAGRSLLFHGLVVHPSTLGRPTLWDGKTYAFLQDCVDQDIISVPLTNRYFSRTQQANYSNVPRTIERANELWAADPTLTQLPPFAADDANVRQMRTRYLMHVPPRYLPLLLERRLTPRQLWTDLVGAIVAAGDADVCAPLVDWCLLAGISHVPNGPSSICINPPLAELADAHLIRHRRSILHHQLPALAAPTHPATDHGTAQLVNFVGLLVEEQRLARADDRDRHSAAKAPKLPSAFWSEDDAHALCIMCDVASEADLPELWRALAAAGKNDRTTIARLILATATADSCPSQAPIATTELCKKISTLQFAGDNIDDLADGIQPFALLVRDSALTPAQRSHIAAVDRDNADYDQLMRGTATTALSDVRALRSTTAKAHVLHSYPEAKALLQATRILLCCLLGGEHPVSRAFQTFLTKYSNSESFYQQRLARLAHGPAILLRFIQLNLLNWFRQLRNDPFGPMPPAPDFSAPLDLLFLDNVSWCPGLPAVYLSAAPAPLVLPPRARPPGVGPEGPTPSPTPTPAPAARNVAVINPNRSPCFAAFQVALASKKINDCLATHGAPPTVMRAGVATQSCLSYHLRGRCFSTCKRPADHAPRTPAEDQQLVAWATVALA